jgi:hypothetical protein
MNNLQREARDVSDSHLDDTCHELDAIARAGLTVEMTEAALADSMITVGEALEILTEQRAVLALCQESYRANLVIQGKLDTLTKRLGEVPAYAVARRQDATHLQPQAA